MSKVCIIIPTYNEAKNLPKLVEALEQELQRKDFTIVVVDDNSPDGTADHVKLLSRKYDNIKLLVRPRKMGLGSAYRNGFSLSSGNFIVTMDADLSHDIKDIPRLIKSLNFADVTIGSRYVRRGKIIGWSWHRQLISRGANFLATLLLRLKVKDATSGFRAYKREVFKRIATKSTTNGFEFLVEALYITKRLGLKVVEIPITFTSRREGKSKLSIREIFGFARSIIKYMLMRG